MPWRYAHWLPFTLLGSGLLLLGVFDALSYGLGLLLWGGVLLAAWWYGQGLWPLSLLLLVLLAPGIWQIQVRTSAQGEALATLDAGSYLRIRGTVREQEPGKGRVTLLLGEAQVRHGEQRWRLSELEVELPRRRGVQRRWFRREIRIGGSLVEAGMAGRQLLGDRLRIVLRKTRYHTASVPIHPWKGEPLRAALQDRAGYYLSAKAAAVYLPIVLGVRERSSLEAKAVVETFRRVGVSHLFAISGLHIGLLFGMLLYLARYGLAVVLRGQGWRHARLVGRGLAALCVWGYIALIGFPVPAVRAATMASMLLWADAWGTRTPGLYVLLLAGLLVVGLTPSVVYDISFQLSFLSFFFLIIGLELLRRPQRRDKPFTHPGIGKRMWEGMGMNLGMTFWITLGIWPVLALYFGRISLLVFIGNLLMLPLLGVLVLPCAILTMLVSMAYRGELPGAWPERLAFESLEAVLTCWLWLVEWIDRLGQGLVLPITLDWHSTEWFSYYTLLVGAMLGLRFWRRRKGGG